MNITAITTGAYGRTLMLGLIVAAGLVALPAAAQACGEVDLYITKIGPSKVEAGDTLTYRLMVHADKPHTGTARQVSVIDRIPQGLVFLKDQTRFEVAGIQHSVPSCKQEGDSVNCRLPQMNSNSGHSARTIYIYLTFEVPQSLACTTLSNQASVSSLQNPPKEFDVNMNNNTSDVVKTKVSCPEPTPTPVAKIHPGLHVSKTDHKDITRPGHSLTYVIRVENTGDVDLEKIEVRDSVPGKLTVNSISDGGERHGNTIVWQGSLGAGEVKELTFTATVHNDTPNNYKLENLVIVESNDPALQDEATDITIVQRLPEVAAIQTPAPAPVPVTAETGAGSLALISTLMGSAGLAFLYRRGF